MGGLGSGRVGRWEPGVLGAWRGGGPEGWGPGGVGARRGGGPAQNFAFFFFFEMK